MTIKQSLAAFLVIAATSAGSIWGYGQYQQGRAAFQQPSEKETLFKEASFQSPAIDPEIDFEKAAGKAVPSVVHITTVGRAASAPDLRNSPFRDFFGDDFEMPGQGRGMQPPAQRGSGSGVIITADGYIVTNNHVVAGAEQLNVTLSNNKEYKGRLVGRDPSSDLAVIKIEEKELPFLSFANSDNVRLGQWVLAIGYPLNLEATVTSGIVSAKSRSLGINSRQSNTPLEAFIQTDAAINPGNSGGALVNTNGDLVGINSAIASPTGSYAGYGYAIPSNMVNRIASDIIKYGSTKRAYLGIMFGNSAMSAEEKQKNNVPDGEGVYVMEVSKNSAAAEAGIRKGDFITKLNGTTTLTGTQVIEKIAALRPGDEVAITYNRDGSERTTKVKLKGEAGVYASNSPKAGSALGATLESLTREQAAQLQLTGGVVVKSLGQGTLSEQTRIREGFIITKINDRPVPSVASLQQALQQAGTSAIISGVYPNNPQRVYQYAINDLS